MQDYRLNVIHLLSAAGLALSLPFVSMAQISPPFSASPGSQAQAVQTSSEPVTAVSVPAIMAEPHTTAQTAASGTAESFAPVERDAGLPRSGRGGFEPASQDIGDATRALLILQADTTREGSVHHVLGATAGRTWQRYLDSFEYPIPQRFDIEVESGKSR